MRKTLIFILLIYFPYLLCSQPLSNLRSKVLYVLNDTIRIDTLSIVPNSEIISTRDLKIIPKTAYNIHYLKSELILNDSLKQAHNQFTINYRVFPINFTDKSFSRQKESTIITGPVLAFPERNQLSQTSGFFSDNQINKQGSISRGITIGNNQDAVINSNLNIQLSGKLSDNLNILAAISDENIPVQPEGNSQQIQEFDKVFIQLYNEKTKLIAGDFDIYKPDGYFLNITKKAQGGLFNTSLQSKKNKDLSLNSTISGAISKGKYCRKSFQGQEGNQGPYKLTGCENEQFIIVLAGTEKVYINGMLKTRGKEYDYTIDYNTGEIVFTANQPITKDSRIAIEFEYSERSYSRFLVYTANTIETKSGKFWLNVYSEQDSKNQTLNQDLTQEQKQLLSESGDQISNAFIPNVDSVGFRNDYVLYKRIDTTVNNINYAIYKYSIDPEKAVYQVGFSFTGKNKGNYIQIQNAANGKVFEWVAPVNNIPQGEYEPVRLLIAPKKQQLVNAGGQFQLNKTTESFFELALSNYDMNTFSDKDASDNVGYAFKFDLEKGIIARDTSKSYLNSMVSYQHIDRNFTTPEKFRSIEFERDWNLSEPLSTNEHLASLDLSYRYKTKLYANYGISYLNRTADYEGYKNRFNLNANKSGYRFTFNSSLLNTSSKTFNTEFIRYIGDLSKSFKLFSVGFENETEHNEWKNNMNDSLSANSFSFTSYKVYVENSDSSANRYSLSYTLRDDYLPSENKLSKASRAEDFSLGFALLKNPKSILKTRINYRMLDVKDSSIIQQANENSLTGRMDYTLRIFKGAISSSTYYEAGSGLEPKREFSYLKVSTGQGVYAWTDYNENGVTELDEFEVAKFQDQANYIRIYTPGNEYIKTYKNEFSQILNFHPDLVWRSKKGIKKMLSNFSNSLSYFISRKSTNENYVESLNPFTHVANDSSMINLNQNLRNTFSFNRTSSTFGIDYIYQKNISKILLSNGFDTREKESNMLKIRWRLVPGLSLENLAEKGLKKYDSQFFSNKNYTIENLLNQLTFQYQPGIKARFELNYAYNNKNNKLSIETSTSHKLGTEINYSLKNKGNLLAQGNYHYIQYNSDIKTAIAYEMLEGLKPGNNATWSIIFQRKLAGNLELSVNYSGRVSEKIRMIHTGGLQVRAFF